MDGSDQIVSSSTSIKPSAVPKASASDENDQNYQQTGPNLNNPNKSATKNFMSPTISAASKAVVPRKKILAERNETSETNFSYTHVQKSTIIDSKATFTSPGIDNSDKSLPQETPLSSWVPGFDDYEENAFVGNLSSRAYDPLTNYLSPRPKFLRYKPSRRREIFLRRENEIKEGKDGLGIDKGINDSVSFESQNSIDEEAASVSGPGSSASSSHEGFVKQEDDEMDESDEEIEDVEEERGWSLKGVLKFLLLIVVLGLCTLYISSMNALTPSPPFQAFEGLKDGYYRLQNHISGGVKNLEGGSYHFLDEKEGTQTGFMEVNTGDITGEGIEEEDVDEDVKMGEVENIDDLSEVVELQGGESEAIEKVEDEKMGMVDELGEDACDHEQKMVANTKLQGIGSVEGLEPLQNYQMPLVSDGVDHHQIVPDLPNAFEEESEVLKVGVYTEEVADELVESEIEKLENITDKAIDVVMSERKENENANCETVNSEAEGSKESLVEHTKTESNFKAMMGISVFSLIAASLVLGFHFKRKRTIREDSSPIRKPSSETVIVEKCSSVLPNVGQEQHIEHIDSFAKPLSSIHFKEEVSRECYQSRAPTIELLGEFEVGEVSSSLKSFVMRSTTIETIGGGESIDSFSTGKRLGSKAHSVPIHPQQALSEFSATNSPSYGSFTAEKKFVNKEEGGDGEVTTPVRRSSRLRNRAVVSP